MCGRYTHLFSWAELYELLGLIRAPEEPLSKRYNVSPTQRAPIVMMNDSGEKIGDMLQWGLIPAWLKDETKMAPMINARGETVNEKPSFKGAFRSRRCLVPISGFYEWKRSENGKTKEPYYVQLKNGSPMILAGIWEKRKGDTVPTFAVITTEANALLKPLHDRMPVILCREEQDAWLNSKCPLESLQKLFKPLPPDQLNLLPVSAIVNSPKNDCPSCIEPIMIQAEIPV